MASVRPRSVGRPRSRYLCPSRNYNRFPICPQDSSHGRVIKPFLYYTARIRPPSLPSPSALAFSRSFSLSLVLSPPVFLLLARYELYISHGAWINNKGPPDAIEQPVYSIFNPPLFDAFLYTYPCVSPFFAAPVGPDRNNGPRYNRCARRAIFPRKNLTSARAEPTRRVLATVLM